MQQLAIEWFAEELYKKFEMKGPVEVFDEIFEEALKMNTEQIKNAYHEDRDLLSHYEDGSAFEQYYNETFKQQEQ
jgi:hypothetical protein